MKQFGMGVLCFSIGLCGGGRAWHPKWHSGWSQGESRTPSGPLPASQVLDSLPTLNAPSLERS